MAARSIYLELVGMIRMVARSDYLHRRAVDPDGGKIHIPGTGGHDPDGGKIRMPGNCGHVPDCGKIRIPGIGGCAPALALHKLQVGGTVNIAAHLTEGVPQLVHTGNRGREKPVEKYQQKQHN